MRAYVAVKGVSSGESNSPREVVILELGQVSGRARMLSQ
jgi:hypothetical protein